MKVSIFTPTHDPKYLLDVYASIKDQPFDDVKLCECGCGRATTVYKGRSRRFIRGHSSQGRVFSAQHRANIAKVKRGLVPWNKGKVHPSETREKIRIKALGRTPWNKGIPRTEECKKKISLNHADCSGKNNSNYGNGSKITKDRNPNWHGGISKTPYPFDFDDELKDLIRKRDGYLCRLCGVDHNGRRKMPIHHVDYDKTNCNPTNLITLCGSCHSKTTSRREYWAEHFGGMLSCHLQ